MNFCILEIYNQFVSIAKKRGEFCVGVAKKLFLEALWKRDGSTSWD